MQFKNILNNFINVFIKKISNEIIYKMKLNNKLNVFNITIKNQTNIINIRNKN